MRRSCVIVSMALYFLSLLPELVELRLNIISDNWPGLHKGVFPSNPVQASTIVANNTCSNISLSISRELHSGSPPSLSSHPPMSFNAEVTLGPALVGTTAASCLFGCSVIQTYGYYKRFPSDFPILKSLVSGGQNASF